MHWHYIDDILSFESFQERPAVQWGLYAIFIEKLFGIFPREQIYVNNLHVWAKDRIGSLERLFSFMGLGKLII